MRPNGPTTILHFSTIQLAYEAALDVLTECRVPYDGNPVVLLAGWWETHGGSETYCSEHWKPIAPNMFVAMSPKK